MPTLCLALDKSARYYDADGRLHVRLNNISKAAVNPYRGAEIPDFEALGLDPNKIYKLLRDPDELAKAAGTFNNLPLLDQHVPVSADEHMPELVVGSLGTDAAFSAPYLQNSLVVWAAGAIAGVEADKIKELSSAYRYKADMTPGEFEGLAYDGIMRNIVGNHVALVEAGRAGSDVVVGDSQLEGPPMPKLLKSRKAVMINGALAVHLQPRLAQDAKLDLTPFLAGVTAANYVSQKAAILAGVTAATKGKLAQDAELGDVAALIDAFTDVGVEGPDVIPDEPIAPAVVEEEPPAVDDGGDDVMGKVMAFLQGKLSDEDMAALTQLCAPGAADTPPPFEGKPEDPGSEGPNMNVDKPAMDAAIKVAERNAVNRVTAMLTAREAVKPWVGEVIAMDSATAVYKFALDALDVDVTGVHPSAYATILAAQPKPGAAPVSNVIALDSKAANDFATQYPGAARIRNV